MEKNNFFSTLRRPVAMILGCFFMLKAGCHFIEAMRLSNASSSNSSAANFYPASNPDVKRFTSLDSTISFVVPSQWQIEQEDTAVQAILSARLVANGMIVRFASTTLNLGDSMDLHEHLRDISEGDFPKISNPKDISVAGFPALQYDINIVEGFLARQITIFRKRYMYTFTCSIVDMINKEKLIQEFDALIESVGFSEKDLRKVFKSRR